MNTEMSAYRDRPEVVGARSNERLTQCGRQGRNRMMRWPDLPGTHRNGGHCPLEMEDAMAKALEVNDKAAQNQKGQSQQQSGDKPRPEILEGTSFQVNENSVEEGEPIHSSTRPPRRSEERSNEEKIAGKAFHVNQNSVGDQEPVRSPAPPRRE